MNLSRKTLLAAACLTLAPIAAQAQNWELVSGQPARTEFHRGIITLRTCAGALGDSLAVGTADPGGAFGNTNMVVQRLSSAASVAAPRFRFEYDTSGRPERGVKAVEFRDGSGYAVVGSLDPTSSTAPASRFIVTKLDCSGAPIWRFSYGDTLDYNSGFDILQTGTGNAAAGTSAGDLVALGKYFRPATATTAATYRPRLVRMRANGTPIWVRDYQTSSTAGDFELRAIAELRPVAPSLTGQIVGVGILGTQAAAVQFDGDTGNVVCTVLVGGLGRAQFNDVTVTTTTAGTSEYIASGETTGSTFGQQLYLARFVPNCLLRVHTHWGSSSDREIGRALDLTRSSTYLGAPAGVVMVGGEVRGNIGTLFSEDGFMHLAHPQNLTPYVLATGAPVVGKRYGTQGNRVERIFDIAAADKGAYFAGDSSTDWLLNADPLHALTARVSDNAFKTQCAVDWAPPAYNLSLASNSFAATLLQKSALSETLPVRSSVPTQTFCCALAP